jgi:2-keto-4-pentenoate hydratase/2-oxohepta-3-ene-1,7-dioic acid hydratase in catechol pathway
LVSIGGAIGRLVGAEIQVLESPYSDLGEALADGMTSERLETTSVRDVVPAESRVGPPIKRPPAMWIVGYGYRSHAAESGRDSTLDPFFVLKSPSAVIGTGEPIVLPTEAPDAVDYEGEIAIVMERETRKVSVSAAWDHVLGLTICNDVSARDVQKGRPGARPNITVAKSFDSFAPMGPAVVSRDEFSDPDDLELTTWVDGERRQFARSSELVYGVAEIVSYLSHRSTLHPGTVISTGTPSGVGQATGRFLRAGSVVRVEVGGIGCLENPVVLQVDGSSDTS